MLGGQTAGKMSSIIRFLSRRSRKGARRKGVESQIPEKPRKGILPCKVMLLDGTDMSVDVPVSML